MAALVRDEQARTALAECARIGVLSRDLDRAQTVRQADSATVRLPAGGKSKAEALADAGISTSTAHRYEEIAGGREEQAHG